MTLTTVEFGRCEFELSVAYSVVDTYLTYGFSISMDRELTDDELNTVQENYGDAISEWSIENGSSIWD